MSAEICPECEARPPNHKGPGLPIRQIGTLHHDWCPTLPHFTAEQKTELAERFREIREAEAEALRTAHQVVIW